MSTDKITRNIVIKASPETVYNVISQPEHMQKWFSDEADFSAVPGNPGVLTFHIDEDKTVATTVEITVVQADRPKLFAFSWISPERRRATTEASGTILVEFSIRETSEGTLLTVVESGLGAVGWDDDTKDAYAEDHGKGWDSIVVRLRDVAEAHAAGAAK